MAKRMKYLRSGGRKKLDPPTGPEEFGKLPHEAVTDPPEPRATEDMAAGGLPVVRGNSNSQDLTPEGRFRAHQTGKDLAQAGGVDEIVPSTAKRAQETAQALQSEDPSAPPISPEPGLESQALGNLEGEPKTPEVKKLLSDLIRKSPNAKIPGQGAMSSRPGESFNEYRQRVLGAVRGLMAQLADNPQSRIAVPDHTHVTRLVKAWVAAGHPDDLSIDPDVMTSDEKIPPGSVNRFAPDADGNWKIQPFDPAREKDLPSGSIYFVEHGQTPSTQAKSSQVSSGQAARAQIIKYLRSMDFGRARAVAQRATSSGLLSDQDVEDALDEGLPRDVSGLSNPHLLAVASASRPERRAELASHLKSRFSDLSGLPPEGQRALSEHLAKLGPA